MIPSVAESVVRAAQGKYQPGPIRSIYSWPISNPDWEPFAHQITTADFLTQHPRAFVFNEIGTGKTLASLWAADFLMQEGAVSRVLISSTLSTLQSVWADELFESFPHRTFRVLHGSREKRLKLLSEAADFYIINHQGLKIIGDALKYRTDIQLVIADECAMFRNQRTDLHESLDAIAGAKTKRSLWMMSGAPMPTAPTDVWAQAQLMNPAMVPRAFTRFRDKVMTQVTQFKWVPKAGWENIVYPMLHPCIRFELNKCVDMPDCVTLPRSCQMSTQQRDAYQQMLDHCRIEYQQQQITAANAGVKLSKLLQIACGAVYSEDAVAWLNVKPKLAALDEAIEMAGGKCLIFAPFRHALKLLQAHLPTAKVVHGGVPASARNEIFQDFELGAVDIIVAHPQCMAHGLTLTSANVVIWWSPVDNFEVYEQANGRISRISQKRKQAIVQLSCAPVEQLVYARLDAKERTQDLLLQLL